MRKRKKERQISKQLDVLRPVNHYGHIRAIYILWLHIKYSHYVRAKTDTILLLFF